MQPTTLPFVRILSQRAAAAGCRYGVSRTPERQQNGVSLSTAYTLPESERAVRHTWHPCNGRWRLEQRKQGRCGWATQKFGRLDPRWSAYHYEKAFLSGDHKTVGLQRIGHLAVAAVQPYPVQAGSRPCSYCHLCVAPLQPHMHGDCPHAEFMISLAEATVLEHEAWGPQLQAQEFLQRGIKRDAGRRLTYGFSATGRIPLQAQCPPPQWAVQILSATVGRQAGHRQGLPQRAGAAGVLGPVGPAGGGAQVGG